MVRSSQTHGHPAVQINQSDLCLVCRLCDLSRMSETESANMATRFSLDNSQFGSVAMEMVYFSDQNPVSETVISEVHNCVLRIAETFLIYPTTYVLVVSVLDRWTAVCCAFILFLYERV